MVAHIYKPTKSAMQSGRGKTNGWMLDYDAEQPRQRDPLMGYTSSSDMKSQISLSFDTLEEAETYAKHNSIDYVVVKPKERKITRVAYADNFKYGRLLPWTH
ncbi:MAG: ETC complex I subunit [Hyphomicrobiales bacterium]